jgi:hypothetical protein
MTVAQTTTEYTEKLRQALQRDTTLRQLAAQATTRYAGEKARIDRALVIALNHGVTVHADGTADVQSASDPEVVYHVAHGTCDCPDFERAPGGRCKHRFAVCLVKKATAQIQQAAQYYTSTTPAQGLVLGGHRATADTKRAEEEAAGGLVYAICHHNGARHN